MEVVIADDDGNSVVLKSAGHTVSIEAQYVDGTHEHAYITNEYLVGLLSEKVREEVEFNNIGGK